jgi:hypothetical protein
VFLIDPGQTVLIDLEYNCRESAMWQNKFRFLPTGYEKR